ncbi:MAG: hypothetical protein GC136_05620 [Alphaproteobacteria bacterium]|nr:hypothetical protein [Alphaproteobacteria bacterium]
MVASTDNLPEAAKWLVPLILILLGVGIFSYAGFEIGKTAWLYRHGVLTEGRVTSWIKTGNRRDVSVMRISFETVDGRKMKFKAGPPEHEPRHAVDAVVPVYYAARYPSISVIADYSLKPVLPMLFMGFVSFILAIAGAIFMLQYVKQKNKAL